MKYNDHPEIKDIKNICDVSPHTKTTEGVCKKIEGAKTAPKKPKKKK